MGDDQTIGRGVSPDPLSGRPTGLKVSRQDGRDQKEDAEHEVRHRRSVCKERRIRGGHPPEQLHQRPVRHPDQGHRQEGAEVRDRLRGDPREDDRLRRQDGRGREGVQGQGRRRQRSPRRVVLMEGEATVSVEKLATTVMKLALMSKEADNIIKGARHWESKNMNNEMEIETLETNLKEAKRIASDNEMKSDNLARSLAMMEDELKRAEERVKIAEERVVKIEEELSAIGENQKQLEISEEKARRREEKYQDQIKQL